MNIQINNIIVQGFQLFNKKQCLDFNKLKKGNLFYLTGKNIVEPRLGGNDVGKSTLLNALMWCLFGETSRKLKANNIKSWNVSVKTFVTVNLTIDKKVCSIKRTQSPNSLTCNDITIVQEDLNKLLGVDFNTFLFLVYVSQFGIQFYDLRPEEKLKVFSDILKLQKWSELSGKAKDASEKIVEKIDRLNTMLSTKNGRLEGLQDNTYKEQMNLWVGGQKKELQELQDNFDVVIKELYDLVDEFDNLKISDTKLNIVKEKIVKSREELSQLSTKSTTDTFLINTCEVQLKKLNSDIVKFKKLLGKECPSCTQIMSQKHMDKLVNFCSLDKETILIECEKLYKNKVKSKIKYDKGRVAYELLTCGFTELQRQFDKETGEKRDLESAMQQSESEFESIEKEIQKLKDQENPYKKLYKENIKNIKDVKEQIEKLQDQINDLQKQYSLTSYWIKGFKNVRLLVVSEALEELDICVNNNLQKLGLSEWEVKSDIEKQTQKGTVTKGFDVFVKSPYNDKSVPFRTWGGGASQRLKLAGTLGLMDLISSRLGVSFNLELWDEPTHWLSDCGITDLLESLERRAKETNRKVIIIDHRDFDSFGGFGGVLNIIKDENGSHIEEN